MRFGFEAAIATSIFPTGAFGMPLVTLVHFAPPS